MTRPVTVRLNPAVPGAIRRPSAIGVSTPTGSISEVTTTNVLNESTRTDTHCHGVVRAESDPVCRTGECEAMTTNQAARRTWNNGDLLKVRSVWVIDRDVEGAR
ncbi:hypothetical protein GCM10022224_097580 [Nonomuraea antimicrobica]|uniref:Uncharacterized protein n=1 Tax=Nonomuraea antimicrobica TaxID=561173 RepID=A0ABP7EDD9_9ACTN